MTKYQNLNEKLIDDPTYQKWRTGRGGFSPVYSKRSLIKAFFDEMAGKPTGPKIQDLRKTCQD